MTSGQIFDYEKSSIIFCPYVPNAVRQEFQGILGFTEVSSFDRYLGLPAMVGRQKRNFFNELRLRVDKKLSDLREQIFSCGRKEVVIKAVAQAIPAYTMTAFCLPMSICESFQLKFMAFWWGSNDQKCHILDGMEGLKQSEKIRWNGLRGPYLFQSVHVS